MSTTTTSSISLDRVGPGRWTTFAGPEWRNPGGGLWGGKTGGAWEVFVKAPGDEKFAPAGNRGPFWPEGTEVLQNTGGGCGWGNPLERDTWRVLDDVLEGYISAEAASKEYGVVLTADRKAVDEAATAKLRAEMAASSNGH